MRNQNAGVQTHPSQHQVREITARKIPVPPSYEEAQALLDSFPPTSAQLKRLKENGLTAATRGEAKEVLAKLVQENPELEEQWKAENRRAAIARGQARRGEQDPSVTPRWMFEILAEAGAKEIPSDAAAALTLIEQLPPSENMVRTLREHGRTVPETRGEALAIIRDLPATPEQVVTIMRRTGGRWAPKTRGEADQWFSRNSRDRSAQPAPMAA